MNKNCCRVMINGKVFDTLKKAAEFLKLNVYDLSGILNDMSEKEIKGFKVKRLDPRGLKANGKIYCAQTNQLFKDAYTLSKYLNYNYSLICTALRNDHKFVRGGNVYCRVQNEKDFTDLPVIDMLAVEKHNLLNNNTNTNLINKLSIETITNENISILFKYTKEALKELVMYYINAGKSNDAKILIDAIKVLMTEETEIKN